MKLLLSCLLILAALARPAQADLQGAWIASVHNINFPSKPGLSAEAQKQQAIRLLDTAKSAGLNAVMLQVRPESDALYNSSLEPWSRFLTGTQGASPGYDPLAFFIARAKERDIQVHAWINPYRAAANASSPRSSKHISRRFPQYTYKIANGLWMDPGAPEVRRHIQSVVRDLATRYDLAGIHLDDYFYPYPANGKLPNFPDNKTYAAYRASGGALSKADWRRQNVNTLIRDLGQTVRSARPGMLFGVSPFGIHSRDTAPSNIKVGVDQYHQLFADPVTWLRQGWVDYLSPQLYWRDGGPQCFSTLLGWWRNPSVNPRGIPIVPGIAVDRLESHGWPQGEIDRQLALEKSTTPRPRGGFLLWNIGPVVKNTKGVLATVRAR